MKIIHRYILKETLWPFLFGFLFFNFIIFVGVIFDLTRLLFMEQAPLFPIFKLIFFSLPSFFNIVIPIAFLFAILLSFGRLSFDGEITALRSSGISLLRVESSILLFAAGLTIVALLFSSFLTPWSNQKYKSTYQEILLKQPEIQLKERTIINIDDRRIYAFDMDEDNKSMLDIMLYEFTPFSSSRFPQVTFAQSSTFQEDKIVLEGVELYIFGTDYRLFQYGEFGKQTIYLHPEIIKSRQLEKGSWDMTLAELREKIDKTQLDPEQKKRLKIDFQGRIAIPLATLILGIFAIPLGVKVERGDKSISLGISLVVVVTYYVIFLAGNFLAQAGLVSPFLGAWIPNFTLLSLGLALNIAMIRR